MRSLVCTGVAYVTARPLSFASVVPFRLVHLRQLIALPILASLCASPAGSQSARPNILLITIDTLRADRLGAYGYKSAHTPAIDRLAAEGVRFGDATAHAVLTLPAHAAILTGEYPGRFGLRLVNPANKRKYRVIVVGTGLAGASAAATLAELGYRVAAYPLTLLSVAVRAVEAALETMRAGGHPTDAERISFEALRELVGFPAYDAAAKRYASADE